MSANTKAIDKKAIMRDRRAQGIAAMGLVTREGDRFRIASPSLRGRQSSYEVWRDETGKVRCSCLEFGEQSTENPSFRCEHILAVKHSLVARNTEKLNGEPAREGAATEAPAAMLNSHQNASEKPETLKAAEVALGTPSFEREQNDADGAQAVETAGDEPKVRSLAKHIDIEEQKEMTTKQTRSGVSQRTETREDQELALAAEPVAPIISLSFTNTLRSLRQQVDPNLVKTREGWTDRSGHTHLVEYVEWHAVADILDRVTPTWSHSVRHIVQIGDMVAVTAAITIDGVTREGVGTGTAESEMGIKKAEHDALKRAAVKFGIARELYQRESEVIEKEGAAPAAGQFPRDPLAKSMADLVTPKQLGMIRALGREIGVDVEEECSQILRCKTDELSKKAASSFIDHLKSLQQEATAAGQMRRAS